MDPIAALGELCKATTHAYTSRKRVGGRWQYTYPSDDPKPTPKSKFTGPKPNLGIARADMPQIRSFHREEFLAGLSVSHESAQIPANALSPTQKEIHADVVKTVAGVAGAGASDKPILVSSDGYILDGHHRWAVEMAGDSPDATLNAIKINMKIRPLLAAGRAFAKVEYQKSEGGMDAIEALGDLAKAGPHKYKSRRRGKGGKYEYDYGDGYGKGKGGGEKAKPSKPGVAAAGKTSGGHFHWVKPADIGLPDDLQQHYKTGEATGGAIAGTDSGYTESRAALHEKILGEFIDHVPSVPAGQKPVAVVMMGGMAAGKGTVVKHVLGDQKDLVHVDPDAVKQQLPEFQKASNAGTTDEGKRIAVKEAGTMAHEESADVANEMRKRAVAQRKNLILDGSGKNAKKYAKKIQELKDAGYHIHLIMPHLEDLDEVQRRSDDRGERTGRFVPKELLADSHHTVPGNFPELAKMADDFALFDTGPGSSPPPTVKWSSEGGKETIHDPAFVKKFLETGKKRHEVARERGWMKSWFGTPSLRKAGGTKQPNLPLSGILDRFKNNQGEGPDHETGLEDSEDVARVRKIIRGGQTKKTPESPDRTEKSMDAIESLDALSKGFPPGKPTRANDDPSSKPSDAGAKKMAPVGGSAGKPAEGPAKPGAAPGNAGQGAKGADGEKPEPPAKPGEGQAGATAQPGLDPDKGSIQYPTKVMNPETGEAEFVYLDEAERDPNARFVVSDETGEGAHWECPQDSEDYDAFKQWKGARKKGLEGEQIPHELVQGAMKHAEKHHFDGGPHKAAYDDHLAHQGGDEAPEAPPSHHTVKNGNGNGHAAMNGAQDKGKPGSEQGKPADPGGTNGGQDAKAPPGNAGQGNKPAGPEQKKDLIGKLADFANPHEPSDSDVSGGVPSGRSRTGTEHATSGAELQNQEDGYQAIYGLRRSEVAARFGGGGYDSLRKGLYAFDLANVSHATPISDTLLYDYLCAFIEEACEHEKREAEHRNPVAGEDFYQARAMPVMHELVAMIPKNGNLARAAKKFKVTTEVIAEIMKKKGYITPPTDGHHDHGDYWSHDWDSMSAMGTNERNGPTGEVLMASDAAAQLRIHEEPDARRELTLRKGPEMVHFGYDGSDVFGDVQRASAANIHGRFREDPIVKANHDPACLIHGRDIHSQQISHESFVKCSCPG